MIGSTSRPGHSYVEYVLVHWVMTVRCDRDGRRLDPSKEKSTAHFSLTILFPSEVRTHPSFFNQKKKTFPPWLMMMKILPPLSLTTDPECVKVSTGVSLWNFLSLITFSWCLPGVVGSLNQPDGETIYFVASPPPRLSIRIDFSPTIAPEFSWSAMEG